MNFHYSKQGGGGGGFEFNNLLPSFYTCFGSREYADSGTWNTYEPKTKMTLETFDISTLPSNVSRDFNNLDTRHGTTAEPLYWYKFTYKTSFIDCPYFGNANLYPSYYNLTSLQGKAGTQRNTIMYYLDSGNNYEELGINSNFYTYVENLLNSTNIQTNMQQLKTYIVTFAFGITDYGNRVLNYESFQHADISRFGVDTNNTWVNDELLNYGYNFF